MGTVLSVFLLPAAALTSTLILVGVLLVSGIAKLRIPDDADGWAALGVPSALRKDWLIRLHPIAELALAAALLLLGGPLGVAAAVIAVLLFGAYLAMVWRARQKSPDASCACFGERRPITGRTLLRNGWLTLLAVVSALTIGALPLFGGVAVLATEFLPWTLALAAIAVTFVLVRESAQEIAASPSLAPTRTAGGISSDQGEDAEPEDYLRARTPAVPVALADGTTVTLRELSSQQPILMLAVSESCGTCTPVIERVEEYRALLPEVSVRFLLRTAPDASRLASRSEPQTMHDPGNYVGPSIADHWFTPTAVLLGADGMLAGGPVIGATAIEEFVDDIYESLHGERPPAL